MIDGRMQLLLVEDNPADVGLVEEAFRESRIPYQLHLAEDGLLASQFLRKQGKFAKAVTPDLILLDWNLPKRNGREVLEDIKSDEQLRSIPVIVLTTSDDERDVHRAYGLHANCYLTKPVDLEDFLGKIRSIEEFWMTLVRLPQRQAV